MSFRQMVRHRSHIVALTACALVLAACGQSGGSVVGKDGGRADVVQAKKDLAAVVDTSDRLNVAPIGATIPTGKTVTYMTCQVPVCSEVGRGISAAAKVLGWSVREVPNNGTPAGYRESWQQIAQTPGDGVVVGYPVLPYPDVEKEMDRAGVPVVSSTSPSPVGGHLIAVVAGSKGKEIEGATMANWVIQDASKPVKSVFVYDPAITSLASALPGYRDAMKKNCPSCKVEVLEVSVQKIGPALAQQVVSYLQSNPDVKYVAFGLGDLATGAPAAIKAAGLSGQVRVVVRAVSPANLVDIRNGGITAGVTSELYEAGWRAVDLLARKLSGSDLGDVYPMGLNRLITKANLPNDITVPYSVPGYQDSFKKAWGVS
jgi:ribose transport system substrate-binding protein